MARMHQWVGLSFLSFALTGCVAQEKYNAQKLALASAEERLAKADADAQAAKAEADAYRRNYEAVTANSGNERGLVANLQAQLNQMQRDYDGLNRQYEDALKRTGVVQVALAPEVNTALNDFARQNPDLVDFDATNGIVKFRSDVTFNVGSADLRPEARTAISRFATILNSPSAAGYNLQVAGHTDSQRVANQATIKAGHLDNWYLSSHRAIAVGNVLQSQGVNSKRLAVVGYADQHPVADNANEAGRRQNRRVEVLILPTQARGAVAGNGGAGGPAPAPRAGRGEANKDTAELDNRPAANK